MLEGIECSCNNEEVVECSLCKKMVCVDCAEEWEFDEAMAHPNHRSGDVCPQCCKESGMPGKVLREERRSGDPGRATRTRGADQEDRTDDGAVSALQVPSGRAVPPEMERAPVWNATVVLAFILFFAVGPLAILLLAFPFSARE